MDHGNAQEILRRQWVKLKRKRKEGNTLCINLQTSNKCSKKRGFWLFKTTRRCPPPPSHPTVLACSWWSVWLQLPLFVRLEPIRVKYLGSLQQKYYFAAVGETLEDLAADKLPLSILPQGQSIYSSCKQAEISVWSQSKSYSCCPVVKKKKIPSFILESYL